MDEDNKTTEVYATTTTVEVYIYTPSDSNIIIDEV